MKAGYNCLAKTRNSHEVGPDTSPRQLAPPKENANAMKQPRWALYFIPNHRFPRSVYNKETARPFQQMLDARRACHSADRQFVNVTSTRIVTSVDDTGLRYPRPEVGNGIRVPRQREWKTYDFNIFFSAGAAASKLKPVPHCRQCGSTASREKRPELCIKAGFHMQNESWVWHPLSIGSAKPRFIRCG
jgi:hypothetical protein